MLRRLAFMVLVIASIAFTLAVYVHNAASMP